MRRISNKEYNKVYKKFVKGDLQNEELLKANETAQRYTQLHIDAKYLYKIKLAEDEIKKIKRYNKQSKKKETIKKQEEKIKKLEKKIEKLKNRHHNETNQNKIIGLGYEREFTEYNNINKGLSKKEIIANNLNIDRQIEELENNFYNINVSKDLQETIDNFLIWAISEFYNNSIQLSDVKNRNMLINNNKYDKNLLTRLQMKMSEMSDKFISEGRTYTNVFYVMLMQKNKYADELKNV